MLVTVLAAFLLFYRTTGTHTFIECVAKGNPILESFPRQCRLPDGTLTIEPIALEDSVTVVTATSSSKDSSVGNTVLIFLGNSKENPNVTDCSRVYPVQRSIDSSSDPQKAALEQLLSGPTEEEKVRGFASFLPEGASLKKLSVQNGVARAEFDAALEQGVAGSCRVASIRAQITKTLKQFTAIKDVIISVDGKVNDILQP